MCNGNLVLMNYARPEHTAMAVALQQTSLCVPDVRNSSGPDSRYIFIHSFITSSINLYRLT